MNEGAKLIIDILYDNDQLKVLCLGIIVPII